MLGRAGTDLIPKCCRLTFVEQLTKTFLADLELFYRCCCWCSFFCQASRYRHWIQALSAHLDSANWPVTTYGLLILSNTFLLE